jgi:cold shock CspA family protein
MIWFNDEKGAGFISTEEGERLSVSGDAFASGPPEGKCSGLAVEFQVAEVAGERRAENVTVVEDAAPRRARRRSGHR